jgi:hypothetical protein
VDCTSYTDKHCCRLLLLAACCCLLLLAAAAACCCRLRHRRCCCRRLRRCCRATAATAAAQCMHQLRLIANATAVRAASANPGRHKERRLRCRRCRRAKSFLAPRETGGKVEASYLAMHDARSRPIDRERRGVRCFRAGFTSQHSTTKPSRPICCSASTAAARCCSSRRMAQPVETRPCSTIFMPKGPSQSQSWWVSPQAGTQTTRSSAATNTTRCVCSRPQRWCKLPTDESAAATAHCVRVCNLPRHICR